MNMEAKNEIKWIVGFSAVCIPLVFYFSGYLFSDDESCEPNKNRVSDSENTAAIQERATTNGLNGNAPSMCESDEYFGESGKSVCVNARDLCQYCCSRTSIPAAKKHEVVRKWSSNVWKKWVSSLGIVYIILCCLFVCLLAKQPGISNNNNNSLDETKYEHLREIAKDLTERFKHRHQFFWSTFYKLLIYHLTVGSLPLFLINIFWTNPGKVAEKIRGFDCDSYPNILLGLFLPFAVSLFLLVSSWCSTKYLIKEDNRVKVVVEASRKVYNKLKLPLATGDSDPTGGLGYAMAFHFLWICNLYSIIVTAFYIVAYSVLI
ncbi:MAG: hypothetical protein GY847_18025 [Proteobacteria bacterium]|nr:hypothetical protein [Pseudomonadota bacterium]